MAKKIIVFSGKKQVGKDSSCDFIMEQLKLYRPEVKSVKTAFADSLKQLCIDYMGLTSKQCYGSDDDKNTLTGWKWSDISPDVMREIDCAGKNNEFMTAREVLQVLGTNVMRRHFCGDIWAKITFERINSMSEDVVFLSDARFPNEIKYARDNDAIIVRIKRPNNPVVDSHFSEVALDKTPDSAYNYVIETDDLSELLAKVDEIMIKEGIYETA